MLPNEDGTAVCMLGFVFWKVLDGTAVDARMCLLVCLLEFLRWNCSACLDD